MPAIQLESAARSICQEQGLAFVGIAGVGAFKETYRTFDGAGTPWALKVYLPGKAIARAEREITAMLRCSHPNIARLASVGLHSLDSSQYCYLIEEFLPGGTLSAEIETRGTMFPREAVLELGTALISAIGCVAAARLVHRDLKPENVMLRADGRTPVIVDFGLVRHLDESSLTQSWAPRGPCTPLFAPAEQLCNDKSGIDWRADQFALGILLSLAGLACHPYLVSGEDSSIAVQRMASRSGQTQQFLDLAAAHNLPALVKMTEPWPIGRYRTPERLASAWEQQSGVV